jgi:hypothetical protein
MKVFVFLFFYVLKGTLSEICRLTVNTPLSPNHVRTEIIYFHLYNPSPALVTFRVCIRKLLPQEDCETVLKYFHSHCLKESHAPDLSFLEMLHLISFENPVKLRSPININSLIPLDLNLMEFIDIINTNVDMTILTTPRDMSSQDISPYDIFHLSSTLDFTDPHGAFLEFGSFRGRSTQLIETFFLSHSDDYSQSIVYGFDSFLGLPEEWRDGFPSGSFGMGGVPPFPETDHIRWVIGTFDQTVPPFLATLASSSTPISFMHIDCDLYSSTSIILSSLLQHSERLIPTGSCVILLFNELIDYSTYEDHEIKAFHEFYRELVQKHHSAHHIVLELLPRLSFNNPESVGFRLCLFQRMTHRVSRRFY